MADSFTKAKLITEIAAKVKLSKADVGRVLETLTELAYREAANGFVVPGICKLKVIAKKASRRRNPVTGQTLLIGERKALKIVALKKAKTAVAPNTGVVVQVLEPAETPVVEPAPAATAPVPEPAPPVPAPGPIPAPATPSFPTAMGEEGQIVFPCPECGSMLAASPKMAGQDGECPFCNAKTSIPDRKTDAGPEKQGAPARTHHTSPVSDFVLFVCRACGQEIEAPVDMIGMEAECPTCGTNLTVPIANAASAGTNDTQPPGKEAPKVNRSSMTIRIDLSDLE